LSKVSRIRSSRVAHESTSGSFIPGAAFLIHTTSCPAAISAVTAVPGNFRWQGSAYQAALGKTFSELNVSRAYARQAMTSS
jgi:hypothetical protein